MKKKFVYLIILLLAIIWQTSISPVVSGGAVMGNTVLMAVLAWSILDGFYAFIGWAVLTGILYDLAAYSTVGEHVLIFLVVIYFVSFFSRYLSLEVKGTGLLLMFAFVIVATLLSRLIISLVAILDIQTIQGYRRSFGPMSSLALQIVYNEFLFFFWFYVLRKIKKFFAIES
jgi:rod shape-determining protein MreD